MKPTIPVMLTLLASVVLSRSARADGTDIPAARGTPVLDGRLDDEAWTRATPSARFVQRSPNTGAPARHATTARVLYDDRAIYVGIQCETDARPIERLARRDVTPTGEWVRVLLDTRGEGSSAFAFVTNPAGGLADAVTQGDSEYDDAWNAVWDAQTHVTDHGWSAEMELPWSELRFDAAHPAFGVQIERFDETTAEFVALVPIAMDAPRFVAAFARLRGIDGLRAVRPWRLEPYVMGRARLATDPLRLDPTPVFSGSFGLDGKLGITNDLILDATINPDFGQVELDPAVVNLTTYESFFSERRPFFLEGSDLFRTPLRLVHTRRIGAAPSVPDPTQGGAIVAVDPVAPVYGAVKLSGRVGSATVAVLDGLTGPAHAREAYGTNQTADLLAAPMTNWSALRVRMPYGPGSTLGALFTNVARFDAASHTDVVGAGDWDLRAPDGLHRFRGQLAASHAWNVGGGLHDGTAFFLEAARAEHPTWIWSLRARGYSPTFDPNGLGYLERADLIGLTVDTTFRTARPAGAFRTFYVNPWAWHTTNNDGLVIDQGLALELGATTRALWSTGIGGRVSPGLFDDRETRGGMPLRNGPSVAGWAWLGTDPRRSVRGSASGDVSTLNGGARVSAAVTLAWTPLTNVTLSLTGSARWVVDMPRWVENLTAADGTLRPVFGRQNADILDATLRAAVAVNRRISVDLYSQLLSASVQYDTFRELVAPDRLAMVTYTGQPGLDRVSFVLNAVARYEYRPGSFFTLVVVHRSGLAVSPTDVGWGTGLGLLARTAPDTAILAKMTVLWH